MPTTAPIHLLAHFSEKDHFLQNYMFHVPTGGLFVDLGHGTPPPLMAMDRREMVGQIAEIKLSIASPKVEMFFRGAITYASPFKAGINHRRLGVEFFRYETGQKDFLLDLINDASRANQGPTFRQTRRFPANVRVQFQCASSSPKQDGQVGLGKGLKITGRTEELSAKGCSFHSVRFLRPGSKLQVNILLQANATDTGETQGPPEVIPVPCTVRWHDAQNFTHRYMGLEFDFVSQENQDQKTRLENYISSVQSEIEQELLFRRRLNPSTSA